MPVITLTTDLGIRDHYAASLKGTLLSLIPSAIVCDVSHEISPFNLMEAAFVLKSAYQKFPPGTVHLIGVDPEGGRMPTIAMSYGGHFFVAADNGVLSLIREEGNGVCVRVEAETGSIARSFNVQNQLAPVAAALARGEDINSIGQSVAIKEFRWGEPSFTENSLRGVVLHIDHFGNTITNVRKDRFLELKGDQSFQIFIRSLRLQRIMGSYGDVSKGEALALFSDNGHLEIAIREGSAAQLMGIKVQDMFTIEFYK
jgi:S-adenosyl-L-methionine hydrolase (adenosine-forming)